jgi:hypothetical protein
MRLPRAAAVAGLAVVATTAVPGRAAPPAPFLVDTAGDANFVNGQRTLDNPPAPLPPGDPGNIPTEPASVEAGDILSLQMKSVFAPAKRGRKKTASGFTVTLTLAAAPTTGMYYRIRTVAPLCENFWLEYDASASTTGQGTVSKVHCLVFIGGTLFDKVAPPVVKGSTITWTVPLSALNGKVQAGHAITKPVVEARVMPVKGDANNGWVAADYADNPTGAFKVGS